MSAAELIAHVALVGVRLEARGDKLRYFPRSAVNPELCALLKTHKADLLAIIGDGAAMDPIDGAANSDRRDSWGFPLGACEVAVDWS